MVLILGGAHDIVATTAVDLKKALRHSLLLLESAHAFFFHGLLLILTRVASRRLYEVMLLQMLSAFMLACPSVASLFLPTIFGTF